MPPAATIAARLAAWLMARLHSARAASAASSESGSTSPAGAEAQAWPPPREVRRLGHPWAEPQAPLKVEAYPRARGVLRGYLAGGQATKGRGRDHATRGQTTRAQARL